MRIAVILHSDDPETVWNAFRFGGFTAKAGEEVTFFLTGRGVEAETLDTEQFKVSEMMRSFTDAGGNILTCGTCLKLRDREGTPLCPVSNMAAMLELIRSADRVLTF